MIVLYCGTLAIYHHLPHYASAACLLLCPLLSPGAFSSAITWIISEKWAACDCSTSDNTLPVELNHDPFVLDNVNVPSSADANVFLCTVLAGLSDLPASSVKHTAPHTGSIRVSDQSRERETPHTLRRSLQYGSVRHYNNVAVCRAHRIGDRLGLNNAARPIAAKVVEV